MTDTAVAARYAEALADIITANNSQVGPHNAVDEFRAFEATLKESAELYIILTTPSVAMSRKKAVVGRIADDLQLSPVIRNFLMVVVGHRRIPLLSGILQSFEEALDQRLGYVRAEVVSARDLSADQRATLNNTLERLSGKLVRMRFHIDESLIGGVLARIGSTVYDGSVRGQLQSLERRLIRQE